MKRLQEFLDNSNFSVKTKMMKFRYLRIAFKYFKSNGSSENFLDISAKQFQEFFKYIDSKPIGLSAKRHYLYSLKNYADFYQKELIAENSDRKLINYDFIFSKRFYPFRDSAKPSESDYLEMDELFDLLEWAKQTQPPKIYYAICVIATTGCHIEGLLSLQKNKIDWENRKMELFDKGPAFGSKIRFYVINQGLLEPLKAYVNSLDSEEYLLFKISPQKFNKRLHKWKSYMHSRIFRDTINSVWEEMDVEESIRDILCNRIPKSVNAKHYLHKFQKWSYRIQRYDKIDFFKNYSF